MIASWSDRQANPWRVQGHTGGATGRCTAFLTRSPFRETEASYVYPMLPTSCTHHSCLGKHSQELSQPQKLPSPLFSSSCGFPFLRCQWGTVFIPRSSGPALVSSEITEGLQLSPDFRMDDNHQSIYVGWSVCYTTRCCAKALRGGASGGWHNPMM